MSEVSFSYVTTADSLAALSTLILGLDEQECIGIDTEFIRDMSYYPQLCLMQLWVREQNYIVDPQSVNLKPLLESLNATSALLLVYSGAEDFETIVHVGRTLGINDKFKARCLDLQVLIAMLNLRFRMGLATAVATFLGHELQKNETRSDWANRPLTASQLNYAVLDVWYLKDLYLKLVEQASPQQLEYAFAETREILLAAFEILDPEFAYIYVDKTANLNQGALTRLQFLVQKRLEYARDIDEAVNRVITTSALPRIADGCPSSFTALAACNMKWGAIREHGSIVLKWIKQARALPENPELMRPLAYFANAKEFHDQLRRLKHVLQQVAEQVHICPELLTQKKLLADHLFCRQYGKCARLKRGWRANLTQQLD